MSKADKQTLLNSSVEMIHEYYDKEHKRNKDRIKYGIIAMAIIPIVFLILLFVVNSSKVVFLVMWIASLFIISGYLIAIEYKDYNMTENLKGIIDSNENDTLIDTTKVIKGIAMNYVNTDDETVNEDDIYDNINTNPKDTDNTDAASYAYQNNNAVGKAYDNIPDNGYIDVQAVNKIYDENNNLSDKNDNMNTDLSENNVNTPDIPVNKPAGNIPCNTYTGKTQVNPADCQNITIDNRINNNTITISIDNKTSAINITINPNKEAGQ